MKLNKIYYLFKKGERETETINGATTDQVPCKAVMSYLKNEKTSFRVVRKMIARQ